MSASDAPVQTTIIDFTLSRLESAPDSTVFTALSDEELFTGEGDSQFDVYRQMRAATASVWESYRPGTNVIWLAYLVRKLLHEKQLKKAPAKGAEAFAFETLVKADELLSERKEPGCDSTTAFVAAMRSAI